MGGERTDSGQHIDNGTAIEGRYTDSHDHVHGGGSGRDMVGRQVTYSDGKEVADRSANSKGYGRVQDK